MDGCTDLYLLSTIACELAKCFSENELAVLATNLTALGDMLDGIFFIFNLQIKLPPRYKPSAPQAI